MLALAMLVGAWTRDATAQAVDARRVTVAYRDLPAAEALDRLVAATGMSLVYDAALVGSQRVFCLISDTTAETVLRCIVREAGLDFYRLSSGTYVLIAPAAGAPRYATLAGVVVDGATGEPVPAARVTLDAEGPARDASAGGTFAFMQLAPGRYRLQLRAIGYRPFIAEVEVPPSGMMRERFALARQPLEVAPLIVNGIPSPLAGRRWTAERGAVELDALATALPGPDLLLPGASSQVGVVQRALLGDLHIQGGEAGEHQFRLDGVPVFDPLSLGRLFGAFSPLAIQRMTIRKAGFGAPHGSYGAGVVDLEQTAGDEARAAAVTSVDPYAASARISAPITVGARRVQLMLSGRTSLWNLAPSSPLQRTLRSWTNVDRLLLDRFDPAASGVPVTTPFTPGRIDTDIGFLDLHAVARMELGAFRSLSGSVYVGDNRAGTDLRAVAATGATTTALASRDEYRWREFGAQVRHEWLPSARVSHMVRVRASRHRLRHDQAILGAMIADTVPLAGAPHEGNTVSEIALESSLRYALGAGSDLDVGIESARTASEMVMANGVYRPTNVTAAAWRGTAYGQWHRRLGASAYLEGGVRVTWLPERRAVYAEPRLSIAGETPLGSGALGWRVATGVFRQFVNQFDVATVGPSALVPSMRFWLPVDASLAPPRAYHLGAETSWRASAAWELRAEGYAKWQPAILAIDYPALLDRTSTVADADLLGTVIGRSSGRAIGVGVRATHTAGPVRLEMGYDYGYARRTFPSRFNGSSQPTPWNEPHRALVSLDLRPMSGVALSLRGRGIWGRTWALRDAYYALLTQGSGGASVPVGLPGEAKLSAVYEADLGASWSVRMGAARVTAGAALLNALGRRNVLDVWLRPEADGAGGVRYAQVPRVMVGRLPMLTLKVAL